MSEIVLWWYLTVIIFVFGACWGSFLNVCVYRIPLDKSVVTPRSHCPGCGRVIAWYDNIPIWSFLALRARCRHCRVKISPRYVLIELLTAILFTWIWLGYGYDWRTPVYWLVAACLIMGTFIDFEHMIIPDRVTIGGMIAGLILSPLLPSLHGADTAWEGLKAAAIGMATGYGILKIIAVLGKRMFKKDAMGMGDVKLMGGLGALLGWQAVFFVIFVSTLVGSVVGIGLIVARHKEWQSRLPYGPYISLAAIVWILGGDRIWRAYWDWIGGAGL